MKKQFSHVHWTFQCFESLKGWRNYFPFQYFVQNNIAYDPEYVFYDIKVSSSILIFKHLIMSKLNFVAFLWLEVEIV